MNEQYLLFSKQSLKPKFHHLTHYHQILRNYLKKIRESGEEGSYIRGEKLFRNNIGYIAEDILEIEENSESPEYSRAASAPGTPSRPSAERTKKEENDSGKAAKKIEEETKEVKNKNTSNRHIDISLSQRRPETRERKNSAKEIQTRSTQKNSK
ncbi:hypothetical protein JTB14_023475 [Gonioctena quinquepunctata]|nr:hypothetical protein JTB14_023475 [Gonioctena quinquepunctata]